MIELGPAQAAPTKEQLIAILSSSLQTIMREEIADDDDSGRINLLKQARQNDLYWRNLQTRAPQYTGGDAGATSGPNGVQSGADDEDLGSDIYDYTDPIYRGYGRKFVAVLGQQLNPPAASPDDPDDEAAIRATQSATTAALYLIGKCDLRAKNPGLYYGLFNFGTQFAHIDYVIDGDKYGTRMQPVIEPVDKPMGVGFFRCHNCGAEIPQSDQQDSPPPNCPQCGVPIGEKNFIPPKMVTVPEQTGMEEYALGSIEIEMHDVTEISVPLDAKQGIEHARFLRWEREVHKGELLHKYGDILRNNEAFMNGSSGDGDETTADSEGERIRSAMASPIGVYKSKPRHMKTVRDTWLTPYLFECVEDKEQRMALTQNFKRGLRVTSVDGVIIDLAEESLSARWQDFQLEPAARIMCDPLGADFTDLTDLKNDVLNIGAETIERSNGPTVVDSERFNVQSLNGQRMLPAEYIGARRPAGGSMADIIQQTEPVSFSPQNIPFVANYENDCKTNSGIMDPIYGGVGEDAPTAEQDKLKRNAALMQLGTTQMMVSGAWAKTVEKACRLLGEFETEQISFGVKNSFGRYDSLKINTDDLREGRYHFEPDAGIPLTVEQQRSMVYYMLDKPQAIQQQWGFDDPMNVDENKRLIGMPGMRTPYADDREAALDTISKLLSQTPVMGQNGQPSPSIPPKPFEDHGFVSKIAREWLVSPGGRAMENPDPQSGYQNVVLWYQAQQQMAASQPPPPKGSVSLTLKGPDIGQAAIQAAMQNADILPQGVPVQQEAPLGPVPAVPPGIPPAPAAAPPSAAPPSMPPGMPLPPTSIQ